ncbi:MAG: PD-(D/E)XK nuclease family protein [Bdellovibrionales bacterium]|nr:PD-(D/E)XK nuclease family protein [Bdellovibrionales bacterium]
MARGYRRTKKIFQPGQPFRLSRSKLEDFTRCPRCFWIDRRQGIPRPSTPPFTLNSAVDSLLKKEFDQYRARQEAHPLFQEVGLEAIPFAHPQMDHWRDALRGGIEHTLEDIGITLSGGVDDVWAKPDGDLLLVDYKATAKDSPVSALDSEWHEAYKRQIEIYQWLFRRNGFRVSPTAYFLYCTARVGAPRFDRHLEFDLRLIPHRGDDSWVEDALRRAHACLSSDTPPPHNGQCEYCLYALEMRTVRG